MRVSGWIVNVCAFTLQGLVYLYCILLVFVIFQHRDDARQLLKYIDPTLGVELPEKSYGENCAIYTPDNPESSFYNVKDAADVFMLSHVIGWFCKMILLRDLRLTMLASVLFEVYEYSLRHMLPNFHECWWDSLILDILVCNGLGMVMGYYFLKFFKMKKYNFFYKISKKESEIEVEKKLDEKEGEIWKPLAKFRYFFATGVILVMLAQIELNAFFIKFVLWIRANHWLNLLRIIFFWLHGCVATSELYRWMEVPGTPVGLFWAFLIVNSTLESLICWKFGLGLFPKSMPNSIFYSWVVVLSGIVFFAALYFPRPVGFGKKVSKEFEINAHAVAAAQH